MAITKFIPAFLALVGTSFASPVAEAYNEVIPGPGMPSLESLGLTSRDLYETSPLDARDALYVATCQDRGVPTCAVADAQACVNYLRNKGNTACVASPHSEFVRAGNCRIYGDAINGRSSSSSTCANVARGAQQVVDSCQSNGRVEGTNAAYGNGNLKLTVRGA